MEEDFNLDAMSLEEFLRDRNVPEEAINKMTAEKIDITAIKSMKEEDLKKYLPAHGDRLAVRSFINKTRRSSLIEKLRRSYDSFGGKSEQTNKKSRFNNKGKTTRKIEIGWMMFDKKMNKYKQVRGPVGGNRKVTVEKSSKAADIQKKAVDIFFPDGVSVHGSLDEFEIELLDYKSHKIEELDVEQMYELTGMTALRFYLASRKKYFYEEQEYRPLARSPTNHNDFSMTLRPRSDELGQRSNLDIDQVLDEIYSPPDFSILSAKDYLENFSENSYEPALDVIAGEAIENNAKKNTFLILRRGFIFEDLMEAFKTHKNLSNIEIEMILPNGQKEVAEDAGGVMRDALSEFWQTFYEKCTVGTSVKVPCLRDDFGIKEWEAVALIVGRGWEEQKYFPIRISKVFIKNCAGYNFTDDDLIADFLRYISEAESDVIRKAIIDFESVELDDILDVFVNYDCKRQISATNFKSVLKGIAEKEVIQKPEFVSKCFAKTKEIEKILDDLDNIYLRFEPSAKNILARLETGTAIASENQERVFSFLRKFIREADSNKREALLRFCTGSDILNNTITITFNCSNGMSRVPLGHTCGRILELPDTYPDFITFRSELNQILSSNIWIMDMV